MTSGPTGLAAPASQTLTITDDETTPVVTLVLAPAVDLGRNGAGASTVTARLSRASSEDVTVTVSAAPVAPAVAGDFELSGEPGADDAVACPAGVAGQMCGGAYCPRLPGQPTPAPEHERVSRRC